MDMAFFCLAKVSPWVGSWTLFLMTAGCCEEHCWAGWKWNDHHWEHLFFSWLDLQHKVWGYEKNIQSCFQQLQNGGVAKSHSSEHHLDANASNVMCIAVICNSLYHILSQGQNFLPKLDSGSWWSLQAVNTTHTGAADELQLLWSTYTGEVCGEVFSVGGTPQWGSGRVWGVLPLRRKQWQCMMKSPQTPFPKSLHHWQGSTEN